MASPTQEDRDASAALRDPHLDEPQPFPPLTTDPCCQLGSPPGVRLS